MPQEGLWSENKEEKGEEAGAKDSAWAREEGTMKKVHRKR